MSTEIAKDAVTSLRVIGAGFSRTGTLSFSKALETLLGGTIYHSGTYCLNGKQGTAFNLSTTASVRKYPYQFLPETIKKWTSILKAHPETDSEYIKDTLKTMLTGYVAITDIPGALFVGELLEIYPDAIVICTTRDAEAWFRSCSASAKNASKISFLLPLFWPLPTMRWFNAWLEAILSRASYNYSSRLERNPDKDILAKHMAYVSRVTPKERLFFFNVQDGWGPLCKILGCPVPNETFPKLNNARENQEFLQGFLTKALGKWLEIIIALGVLFLLLHYAFSRLLPLAG